MPQENQCEEESADLFISKCYRLHGVPKVIISDRNPKFVDKFSQSFMGKLNAKLNMSNAQHPRTGGLTERVSQTMQTMLRSYCATYRFNWTLHLSVCFLLIICLINEPNVHSPFEEMYGYQPPTFAKHLLPLHGTTANATDILPLITDIRDIVIQLLTLSKERMAAKLAKTASLFQTGDLVYYLSTKGLYIWS